MGYTSNSMAKDLILDRTVSVEMFFEDTAWPSITVEGKVDTGADRCSIDETLAEHLGWKVVEEVTVKSSLGRERRPVYRGQVEIRGIRFWMDATGADRAGLSHSILVGHLVLSDLIMLEEE